MKYFLLFVSILCLNNQQVIAQNVKDRLGKSMHLVMDVYHSPTESIDQRIDRAANEICNKENLKVQTQVDKLIEKIAEKDSKGKDLNEEQKLISKTYKDANEYELFDPMDIKEKIDELRVSIDDFESNVDTALALSNATTFIEFEV